MKKICRDCGDEFELRPRKPGLIDQCPAHSRETEELLGGNMVYEHKTAPHIEVKSISAARRFASKTARWGAGITKSLTR